MYARRNHPYDGTRLAGKPTGPWLKVVNTHPHEPVDGVSYCTVCHLDDGTWAFEHNLTFANPDLYELIAFDRK